MNAHMDEPNDPPTDVPHQALYTVCHEVHRYRMYLRVSSPLTDYILRDTLVPYRSHSHALLACFQSRVVINTLNPGHMIHYHPTREPGGLPTAIRINI